ncbi:glycosyltransferase [Candidatus Bathyarchaeota archaeon]|nr:glycosyltransferase [Candidatus Bathyarchaeota archaeon]
MTSSPPKVSVIIPFYKNEAYLRECVGHCLRLDYPNYEIIVVGNTPLQINSDRVKFVEIKDTSQGCKKDAGISISSGEICAFVDDDAYPRRDWLKNAVKYFIDPQVGAVCGPGVTPDNDNLLQKASGALYSTFLGSGPFHFRYVPTKHQYVKEGPGYNILARRSLLMEIGGIATKLRSGEDTLLSQKIREKNMKILYAPDVVVYHHRRPLILPHLRQVRIYALHRGFFVKRFRDSSTNPFYTLPLLLGILVTIGALTVLVTQSFFVFISLFLISVYLLASFTSGLLISQSVKIALLTSVGIPLTHLTYAYGFFQGLVTQELGEIPSY